MSAAPGSIEGRPVYVFAQDFTVFGGSLSETNAEKICKVMDLAVKNGAPIVGLNDSGGARIQEGVVSLGGYADIFLRNTLASGVVPQISAILGPCAGGAVYSPAITDFIFMTEKTSYMFVTGPDVIAHRHPRGRHQGGARRRPHALDVSGVAHFVAPRRRVGARAGSGSCWPTSPATTSTTRRASTPPIRPDREDAALNVFIPEEPDKPYDMKRRSCGRIADDHRVPRGARGVREEYPRRASSASTAGRSASSRTSRCTWRECSTSTRRSRAPGSSGSATRSTFRCSSSRTCPGFLPGTQQEYGGIIRHGAKLLYAFAEATVPKVTVITRKAYGGAYCVMAVQAPADRLQLRLSDGRDRRDGAGRRRRHPVQARARRRRLGAQAKVAEYVEKLRQPLRGRSARLRRRHHRAVGNAANA